MKLTRIDLNSWILQIAGQTVLIDPWLVDPMVFYGQPWLFTAYHTTPPVFTPTTLPAPDLILLSQGLDDHCHKPTLQQLDRNIPVVGSKTAVATVQGLGYATVTCLTPGETYISGEMSITAVPGAPLQGQVENGYLLKDRETGETVYYEPHLCQLEKVTAHLAEVVDVAIAPVVGQVFPLLGQVVMGPNEAMNLVKTLRPRVFVPTALGEIQMSGLLPKLIRSVGSVEQFRDQLAASGLSTKLLLPDPGETLELELSGRVEERSLQ